MKEEDIKRINELARIKKQRELTCDEQQERQALYKQYIEEMKSSLAAQLESITVLNKDGSKHNFKKGPVN